MIFLKWTSLILCCLPTIGLAQQLDYYNLYASKRNEATKVSYTVDYFQLFFSGNTFDFKEEVTIVKDNQDSLFGARIVIENDSSLLTYNGKEISQIHKKNNTIESFNASERPGIFIKSTPYDKLIDYSFISGSNLMEQIQEIPYNIIDTTLDNRDVALYRIFPPDEEDFINQVIEFFIDKESYLLIAKEIRIEYQGNQQINRWKFDEIKYSNDTSIDALEYDFVSSFEKITERSYKSEVVVMLNHKFPNFEGVWSNSKASIQSDQLQNEWLVVDFWYSACYPCIKSIPHVNALYDKLQGEQIGFIGINIIDKFGKDEARIKKFESYNPMRYNTIYPNNPKDFGHLAYPTIVILDRDRNIVFMEQGYSESLEEDILQYFASKGVVRE